MKIKVQRFEIDSKGEVFAVFKSEYEAEQYADSHPDEWTYFACWNGFMNALCLQHSSEP